MRKLIRDRLEELGLTMAEASLKIQKNHAYLQQFLKRGIPAKLKEDDRIALAALLGVPETELRGTSPKLPKREYSRPNEVSGEVRPFLRPESRTIPLDNHQAIGTTFGELDLPVYGTAEGAGGALSISHEAVDYVIRPAPLLKVRDGYGVIIAGNRLAPRIENGTTVLVNPHLPPKPGDTCVFRRGNDGHGEVLVKVLRRFTDETWYVEQYSPQRAFTLKRSEWPECHVVVGTYFAR